MEDRIIRNSLYRIYEWLLTLHPVRNVDTRLGYEFNPLSPTQTVQRRHCPVREIGTVMDISILSRTLHRKEFQETLEGTLKRFSTQLERSEESKIYHDAWNLLNESSVTHTHRGAVQLPAAQFDSEKLGERSHIGHSALMILALVEYCNWLRSGYSTGGVHLDQWDELIEQLANGIISQQRLHGAGSNGSYKVYFNEDTMEDRGLEFYASEAMLALMRAYEHRHRESYLKSVQIAVQKFFMPLYAEGAISEDLIVFFANWQSQAVRSMVQHSDKVNEADLVRDSMDYVFDMHDKIIASNFYEALEKQPETYATVEVACGLEGLVDAYVLLLDHAAQMELVEFESQVGTLRKIREQRMRNYQRAIGQALSFLLLIQASSSKWSSPMAIGGLCHGLNNAVQRLDVSGHTVCALVKLHDLLRAKPDQAELFSLWVDDTLLDELSTPMLNTSMA